MPAVHPGKGEFIQAGETVSALLEETEPDAWGNYCRMPAHNEDIAVISDEMADLLEGGISQTRRGWLEKSNVLNTRPLRELRNLPIP